MADTHQGGIDDLKMQVAIEPVVYAWDRPTAHQERDAEIIESVADRRNILAVVPGDVASS